MVLQIRGLLEDFDAQITTKLEDSEPEVRAWSSTKKKQANRLSVPAGPIKKSTYQSRKTRFTLKCKFL